MTKDPKFANDGFGTDVLPEWFDDDFIEAVVRVAASMPEPRRRFDPRPATKAKALAQHLRRGWSL